MRRLPNALTLSRVVLAAVVVGLLLAHGGFHTRTVGDPLAAAVFAVAAGTDFLDGWLARRWRVESVFGRRADGLADKTLIAATVLMLIALGRLPVIAIGLLGLRQAALLSIRRFRRRGEQFATTRLGKSSAAVLYVGIVAVLATARDTAWPLPIFWLGVVLALGEIGVHAAKRWPLAVVQLISRRPA